MKKIIIILALFLALAGIVEAQVDLWWVENRNWYRGDTWPEWDRNWKENPPLLSIAIKDKIRILCEETYEYTSARKEWETCIAHQENKAKKVLGEYFSGMAGMAETVAEFSDMNIFSAEDNIVERTECIRNAVHFNKRARAHIINWELADACNVKLVNDRFEKLLRKSKEMEGGDN